MIILILGPQGSGKGTQAAKLAKRFGLFYFESGRFLRKLAKKRPDIDEKINKKGELLPDEEIFSLVRDFFENKGIKDKVIFEGFPRSTGQFNLLKSWLKKKGVGIDLAILLKISEKESIRRLTARRVNMKTGKIYNLITNPPGSTVKKKDLVQREDDQEETIRKRLGLYRKTTEPLFDLLKRETILEEIDGERPIEVIQTDLVALLEKVSRAKSKN